MDWADEIATKIAGDFFSQTEGTNLHRGIAAQLRKARDEGKAEGYREAALSMKKVIEQEIATLLHEATLQTPTE